MHLSRLLAVVVLTLMPALALAQGQAPIVPVPNRSANDNSSAPANTHYVDSATQILLGALAGKAPVANPAFSGVVTAQALDLPNADGLRVGGAPLFSALPACTPGSTVAPVPAGQPFVCSGLVLIAQ